MQSRQRSALESAAQIVVGFVINQLVLFLFFPGSIVKNIALSVLMAGVSFGRQYVIRRFFNHSPTRRKAAVEPNGRSSLPCSNL